MNVNHANQDGAKPSQNEIWNPIKVNGTIRYISDFITFINSAQISFHDISRGCMKDSCDRLLMQDFYFTRT